jgi:hypothetical protein
MSHPPLPEARRAHAGCDRHLVMMMDAFRFFHPDFARPHLIIVVHHPTKMCAEQQTFDHQALFQCKIVWLSYPL